MITNRLAAAVLVFAALGFGTADAAQFTVDSVIHGVRPDVGGTSLNTGPLSTGISINVGDTITVSTASNDTWRLNGMNVNAAGQPGFGRNYNRLTLNTDFSSGLIFGSLGVGIGPAPTGNITRWYRGYTDTGSGPIATNATFVSTVSGTLFLSMWDTVVNDNGGADTTILVDVNVTPAQVVPLPGMAALALAGIAGIAVSRRRT